MSYKFESIDVTSNTHGPEQIANAALTLFPILARIATNNDPKKIEELYNLFDLALKKNEGTACHDQIALIAKSTKLFLDKKTNPI